MRSHNFLLQLRPLKLTKEHVMKSKTLFYLILLTFLLTLTTAMHAQTYSVIHTFTPLEVGSSYAGVAIRGNALYGTAGYFNGVGVVYQLTRSGPNWLFSKIAVLPNLYDTNNVVFGPDGHLYGTASTGGAYGGGAVFKLTPQVGPCRDVACYWMVNHLHDFGSGTDGSLVDGETLIWDQQGNMYGTTVYGGTYGLGTVYELTPSGNGYTENVIHSFSGSDGANPYGGLVLDNKGNLFGAASGYGSGGYGAIYELTYVPGVGWTEQILYNFQGADDGYSPYGGLVFDSAGNLYGATGSGGSGGGGTVFELSPSGNTWTFKLLYSFYGSFGTLRALTMDGAGNLYGTTVYDGIYGRGNVFRLSNTENGWVYTSLYDFTGGTDGADPLSNVAIDTDGTLYGTTARGGDLNCSNSTGAGCGVVWMIKP